MIICIKLLNTVTNRERLVFMVLHLNSYGGGFHVGWWVILIKKMLRMSALN